MEPKYISRLTHHVLPVGLQISIEKDIASLHKVLKSWYGELTTIISPKHLINILNLAKPEINMEYQSLCVIIQWRKPTNLKIQNRGKNNLVKKLMFLLIVITVAKYAT